MEPQVSADLAERLAQAEIVTEDELEQLREERRRAILIPVLRQVRDDLQLPLQIVPVGTKNDGGSYDIYAMVADRPEGQVFFDGKQFLTLTPTGEPGKTQPLTGQLAQLILTTPSSPTVSQSVSGQIVPNLFVLRHIQQWSAGGYDDDPITRIEVIHASTPEEAITKILNRFARLGDTHLVDLRIYLQDGWRRVEFARSPNWRGPAFQLISIDPPVTA